MGGILDTSLPMFSARFCSVSDEVFNSPKSPPARVVTEPLGWYCSNSLSDSPATFSSSIMCSFIVFPSVFIPFIVEDTSIGNVALNSVVYLLERSATLTSPLVNDSVRELWLSSMSILDGIYFNVLFLSSIISLTSLLSRLKLAIHPG